MRYISTRGQAPARDFSDVLLAGLAEDGGLFMPESWPHFTPSDWRAMRALHGSELGAQACGVDIVGVKVRTFVVSALMAGLAGALYAGVVGFVSPSLFTLTASITFIAMAIVGGTSSLAGPLVAAVALTLVQYSDALIPGLSREAAQTIQSYQEDIYGLAIVLIVIFAPRGLAGLWKRRNAGNEAS